MTCDDAVHDLYNLGKRFIIPSSFNSGARYLYQLLQDSLAIGREHCKIDILLTMTCNPKRPEITCELLPGQTPSDCPELIARVFCLTRQELLRDITDGHVLEHAAAFVYTI
jgi:hypothetical protein